MKSCFQHVLIFNALLFLCSGYALAQAAFQADYTRDSTTIIGYGVLETSDGGFLICTAADTNSFSFNDWDACLVKTGPDGSLQWNTFIGAPLVQAAIDAVELPSGEFMFAANADTGSLFNWSLMVGKVSSTGTVQWLKHYDSADFSGVSAMIRTMDGNILIGGGSGSNRAMLTKIDTAGNVLWCKRYGSIAESQFLYRVIQTSDSGYAFSGYHTDSNTGNQDLFLVKTDADGDTLFTRTAEFNYFNEGFQLKETPEHDLIIAGNTQDISGTTDIDIMLVKYSATGTLLWSKVYYTLSQEICYGLSVTADSGYVVGGVGTNPFTTEFNTFFFKTNSSGDTLWTRMYDYVTGPYCTNLTSDGHSIAAGQSQFGLSLMNVMPDGSSPCITLNPGFMVLDSLIHATDLITDVESLTAIVNTLTLNVFSLPLTENILCTTSGIAENSTQLPINVYPNPSSGSFTIRTSGVLHSGTLFIYDALGKKVYENELTGATDHVFSFEPADAGIFCVYLTDNVKVWNKKVIVIK